METEIALSTKEMEYVALGISCRKLFPLTNITKELFMILDLNLHAETQLYIKIHEDNVGVLTLGKLEPWRMTPCLKHYAIKYHWFWEQIGPSNIQLIKISSEDQLGDLFTKGLGCVIISMLQKKLMGW
jgi:hypothetical protein